MDYKQMTSAEIELDIIKSIKSPIHFIHNHCKIESSSKGLVDFNLYEYQKDAISTIHDNRFSFFLKSRQMGFTTMAAAYSLWYAMRPGNNILLLSRREDDSMDILRKVRIMHDNLPKELQIPLVSSNATTMEFENKNRIMSLPATERSGAGRSASVIFLDEFSAFPAAKGQVAGEDVWTSILPTISTNEKAKVIVMSTPKGVGNKFANLWFQDNGFIKKFYHWTSHPVFSVGLRKREHPEDGYGEFTSDWAEPLMRNMTASGWAQEFNGDFVQSGRPVFDINSLIKNDLTSDDFKFDYHYACGVDLASGSGNDYHCAQFVCIETGKQVKTMRSQEPLDVFAVNVIRECKMLNNAEMAFENNSGYGIAFMKNIGDYPNLYYQTKIDRQTEKRTRTLGWNTNVKTKELMISDLNLALINRNILLTDDKTISECKTYQYDDQDKMNAQSGFNDDTVIATAIAWQVVKKTGIPEQVQAFSGHLLTKQAPVVNSEGMIDIDPRIFFPRKKKTWRR